MSNCKKSAAKKVIFFCNDCQVEEKPNIEFLRLVAKKELFDKTTNVSLFFLQDGEIDVSYRDITRTIEKGYFFLIPAKENYSIHCRDNARFMLCSFDEKILVYYQCKAGLLYDIYNIKLPDFENCELFTIKANKCIRLFVENCFNIMNSNTMCAKYTQCKTEELLIMLRSYYPNESLACLFQPAFNSNVDFDLVIKQNRDKLFTVEEYAAATHLDRNTFSHRFKEIYGITPIEWINQERANLVFRELKEGKKTITNIIRDYKFSNFPNFIRFCNVHFNNTPGNIRKSLKDTDSIY